MIRIGVALVLASLTIAGAQAGVAKHSVLNVYTNTGGSNDEVGAFVTQVVDHYNINCNRPTCTLLFTQTQQIFNGADTTKHYFVSVRVDGALISSALQANLPAADQLETAAWEGSASVTEGKHLIEFVVQGGASFRRGLFHDTVTVMDP